MLLIVDLKSLSRDRGSGFVFLDASNSCMYNPIGWLIAILIHLVTCVNEETEARK